KKWPTPIPITAPVLAIAGVEPQSGLQMLDREIGLPGPQSQPAAVDPTAGIARIELKATINQCGRRTELPAGVAERVGSPAKSICVVASATQCALGKIDGSPAV